MKKYDRESNTRIWEGWQKWVVYGLMAAFSLFSIYVTLFATWLDLVRYPSFVACIMLIGYLNFPAKKGVQKVNHIPWFDWIIMILGTCAFLYIVVNAKDLTVRAVGYKYLYWYEIVLGIIAILALFELCRRSVGIPIMVVAGCFILYAIYYFWIGKGLSFGNAVSQLTYRLTYTTTGVMTTPIQVCAKFIVVFLIFGAFLERTGISDFFISLANCLAGSSSGGPAKVAVISSALCGMVSGSSVGNTVTTGSVTIPMMKKTGYKPEFAGAVEAAASTGGQIMPPIMGAAAFLMAEYVGVSYSSIIVRAILPAVLYFLGIFICVHLEAKRLGLKGIPREQLPKFRTLAKKLYLLLPLVILIYLVCSGNRTMAYAATISIMACIVVSLFNKDARMTPAVLFDALAKGGQSCISVAAACAIAGVIAGCITMTGLASQIITAVITIANGHLIVALLLTMICCIILGMGVPTTANYCIMASTCAPILIQMGVPTLAAHFFVFYFGIVADITPPVALAAYAGSAIAGSKPMRTAVNATKLAIAAFVVPYIFAFNPAMLLIDTNALEVIQLIITSVVGMVSLGVALEGYLRGPVPWPLRIVAAAGGLFLIYPGTLSDVVGLVVI
ncbi:MAG: TRAP transporter permease, partial [Oscillospiraceae bacterium]|nr:TRAP transporter permease [Oscillospiraceae bacterium]